MVLTARCGSAYADDIGPDTNETTKKQCHSGQMMYADVLAEWCGPWCRMPQISQAELEWQYAST